MPPPRDLWARTSAALDVEQARRSGRRVGRTDRGVAARRARATGTRVFSFPRGGWAPVGAIGSIAAVMVVGFLLGNMILTAPSVPGSTPGIAVLPSATPIALPTPMADSMRAAVDSGEYATTSEVIRDALRLWVSRRELRAREIAGLKVAWDQGKASGKPRPLDVQSIVTAAKAKGKAARKSG